MSKQTKRKITVEVASKTSEQPKSRPSVFERLGTKTITISSQLNEYCRHWSQNGTCPYGKTCKYASTHTLTSPSKRAAKKDEQKKQNRSNSKDDPNKRLHSTIVKALRSPEPEWEQWNQTDLEDADAEMLEKRRQELQRELELQMKMESKLTKIKDKTVKKGSSSSSSNSSSSSTESSSSSEDTSSTSSSTSLDSRSRKAKRSKTKRDSSSSTEPERCKKKPILKASHKHSSNIKITDKKKTLSPILKSITKTIKSPSPPRLTRRLSQTPPLKSIKLISTKPIIKPSSRSPRSQSQTDRKEKHRTPSPKLPASSTRERDRERLKEKERAREKEREKTREKEREREKEKIREKEKSRERDKVREREHNNQKSRSPKRDNIRQSRDLQKKKESPETRSKLSPGQKPRSTNGNNPNNNGSKRDTSTNKNSPATSNKDDRRLDRSRDEDKKKDDRERRDRDRDRDVKDRSLERRKDKRERDDSSRDRNVRDTERRDRERDRRMTREEREAAREKEREEALARCQERQRERERLKELAKKDRENIPSLLHINTNRNRDRDRERDRGLDKPPADRVERLLPLPADRIPPMRKELERQTARSQDRTSNRSNERSDRNRSTNRGGNDRRDRSGLDRDTDRMETSRDRGLDRNNYDYRETRERDRDFPIGTRARDERRHEEKNFDSPYDHNRRDDRPYLEMDEHYDNPREYPEERRGGRREAWDSCDIDSDLVMDDDRRRGYGRDRDREEPRAPSTIKERNWENPDYMNRTDWDRNRRPPAQHEWQEDWEQTDHNSIEEEWRHYNRSMDSWPSEERRRWPQDFPERRPGPPSTSSLRDADEHLEPPIPVVEEAKKETTLGKRITEPPEDISEVKKPCVAIEETAILEDDLSEISDDADEILNREDVEEQYSDNNNINQFESNISVVQQFKNDDTFEIAEQTKDVPEETSNNVPVTNIQIEPPEQSEIKVQSPAPVSHDDDVIDEDGIDNMDFEEISDEELEEEVKVKGLGDALGVDWASLVAESRPRIKINKAGSAKKRWEYYNVLSRIGVSLKMAGEQMVENILSAARNQEKNDDGEQNDCKMIYSIAAIQVASNEKSVVRNNLFASAGPYRRALSARRDLAIRRHLCNLPLQDNFLEHPKLRSPEFFKTVLNSISFTK